LRLTKVFAPELVNHFKAMSRLEYFWLDVVRDCTS
jgi:hypothetical protein